MAKWCYTLDSEGKNLRELINKEATIENIVALYKQIIVCLEAWKRKLKKSDSDTWEYDIDSMIEDLQCACPDVDDDDVVYAEEEKNLNLYLADFYDLCDSARVWIGV